MVDQTKTDFNRLKKLFARNDKLRAAKRVVAEAKKDYDKCDKICVKWIDKFSHRTRIELLQYACTLRNPAGKDYCHKKFMEPTGAKEIADWCRTLSNPLWLKERDSDINVWMIHGKEDELHPFFGFTDFTEVFLFY